MNLPRLNDMPWWGWITLGLVLGGGGLAGKTLEWQIPFVGTAHLHMEEEDESTSP